MAVDSLDVGDNRSIDLWVAGPAALLVAKVTKISERLGGSRLIDKDALDTLRLLRATTTSDLAHRLTDLRRHDLSAEVTNHAIVQFEILFGADTAEGVAMIVRAAGGSDSAATLTASTIALTGDLVQALRSQ